MELRFTPTEADIRELSRISFTSGWDLFLCYWLLLSSFLVGVHLIEHGLAIVGWTWLGISLAIAIAMYEVPRVQARRSFSHQTLSQPRKPRPA